MKRARRSNQAKEDLVEIWDQIAADNPTAANRLIYAISEKCETLVEYPLMGRARNELLAGARSFGVGNYLIFYRVIPEGIAVIRILHGARDLQSVFERETFESFTDEE